jgi:undecaprenyl-diphosphatase
MEIIQSIVLGIVQGLTEFLPISSSGHLALIPWLFRWQDLGLTFDMALHLGTLFALIIYFWSDWLDIFKKWREPLLWLILIACIPAGFFGFKFEQYFETVFRDPRIIALFMIAFAGVLWLADVYGRKKRELGSLNLLDAIVIGLLQVLALMPGVSRSGITMVGGLFMGFSRRSAARFSFLISTPVIAGASLFKMRHIIVHGLPGTEAQAFIIGVLASAIVGALTIRFLMQYLEKHSFRVFVWYRLVVGTAVIAIWFLTRS